jgi:hypothetical protein
VPVPLSGLRYEWEVSHYYKPSASAVGVCRPSARSGQTAQEVEGLMLAYLRNFTGIDVEKNENY